MESPKCDRVFINSMRRMEFWLPNRAGVPSDAIVYAINNLTCFDIGIFLVERDVWELVPLVENLI